MRRGSFVAWLASGARPYQALFLGLGLVLLPLFRHEINPDSLSYLSIARYYLEGRLNLAVNGYWSPLVSWLLVPLLALRVDPLLAVRILNLAVGLVAIALACRLFALHGLSARWRRAALLATVLAFVSFAYGIFEPDFLLACVLIGYLGVLFDPAYARGWRGGAACGALGALAYLTKAYGLYFFLAHFTVISVLMAAGAPDRRERAQALRNLAVGLAVCVGIAAAWGGVLTHKYGYPTLGTTGRYNHAIVGPDAPGDPPLSPGHPMLYDGFMPPPHDRALSVWEDPSLIRVADWSPLASRRNVAHQLRLLRVNLRELARMLVGYSPFGLVFVAFFVLACVRPPRGSPARRRYLYPLLALAIYPLGYLFIAVDFRYLYLCVVILDLMGGMVLDHLDRSGVLTPGRRRLALALFLAAALYLPARFILTEARANDAIYRSSRALLAHPELQGERAASNRRWNDSLCLAWYLGLKYYGEQGSVTIADVPRALATQDVRYYLVWNASGAERQAYADRWPDVLSGSGGILAIYDLRGGALSGRAP